MSNTKAVVEALQGQHAIHGIFGEVFKEMGGKDFLLAWAEENPGKFITLLTKMTPSLTPMNSVSGDVHLHVHNTLAPSALDDIVSDQ